MVQRTMGGIYWFGRRGKMTGAMVAFGCAVTGSSMLCYALTPRAERIRRKRGSAGSASIDGGSTSYGEGWAVAGWFGGDHSPADGSGNPSDFGGGDSAGSGGGGGD